MDGSGTPRDPGRRPFLWPLPQPAHTPASSGRLDPSRASAPQAGELTSVAVLWLAPFSSKYFTTSMWFSWAAMYRGVKPFWGQTTEKTHPSAASLLPETTRWGRRVLRREPRTW